MRTARMSNRVRRALRGGSRGVTLIEALVAMAIVGIIAVAFLGGLATASRSAALADIRTNAESLARTELEYAKSQLYSLPPWEYRITADGSTCVTADCPNWFSSDRDLHEEYVGYTVLVEAKHLLEDPEDPASEVMEGIQEITVTVFHSSRDDAIIILAGYRVER